MRLLRLWQINAAERGDACIAALADYLQADELTHVTLATHWIRRLTAQDPEHRDELVRCGRRAVETLHSVLATETLVLSQAA